MHLKPLVTSSGPYINAQHAHLTVRKGKLEHTCVCVCVVCVTKFMWLGGAFGFGDLEE